MEVCGGHTHAIYRFGLKDVLPSNIELIHGPGCPVCVLPMGRIDDGLALAKEPLVIFTAFGDMMRVPGAHGSPLEHKARGLDVRIVYSPTDALKLARTNPDRHVMFFAIGFETTAPSTALTLMRAKAEGIKNFSVFCNHVTIIPAIRAILDSPDMRLDGFIGPGHVSTVIGCRPYEWIARDEKKPIVVSGFEPLDLLQSIVMLLRQLKEGRSVVENQYRGWCRGKAIARRWPPWPKSSSFVPTSSGAGSASSPSRRSASATATPQWDAERVFSVAGVRVTDPKAAQCGEVLKGVLKPAQCKLFGRECTPEHPVGALDGVLGRLMRSVLQLRASEGGGVAQGADAGLNGAAARVGRPPCDSATPRSRWRTAPAARPRGAWSMVCSFPSCTIVARRPARICSPTPPSRRSVARGRDHHRQLRRHAAASFPAGRSASWRSTGP